MQDSIGNFYDCKLTLSPAIDPVCSPYGFVYSREAILENLLSQKKANKKKLAAWTAQQEERKRKELELQAVDKEVSILAFERKNHAGASGSTLQHLQEAVGEEAKGILGNKRTISSAINIKENKEKMKEMKAFWLPSKTPESASSLSKPEMNTCCPASGKPLKLRDLIGLKFKRDPQGGPHEYIDPVTGDSFTNASRLIVLKTTGDVMLYQTWKRIVEPEGEFEGKKVSPEDVLELRGGGTGFVDHDKEATESAKYFLFNKD